MTNLDLLRKLADQHQYQELRHACQELLYSSEDAALWPLMAAANARLGAPEAAASALQRALELRDQLDRDALLDLAGAHLALLEPDAAEAILGPLLEESPDHPLALARMGLCLMGRGELKTAVRHFRRAGELDAARVGVFGHLAGLHLDLDELNEAGRALSQGRRALAVRRHDLPESVGDDYQHQLTSLQIQLWIKRQAFEEIDAWLERRQEADVEDDFAHWTCVCSTALIYQDRHAHAEDLLREGLKRYPRNKSLLMTLAALAEQQGRIVQAMALIDRVIEQDPDNPVLWAKLSVACLHRFDQRALQAAETAVALAEALRDGDQREDQLTEAVAAQHLTARNALAQAESQLQHYDRADTLFREILDTDPHFVPALRGLGLQQMQRGRIDEAVSLFERIKAIDPTSGHNALIHARRFPDDEETLARLEAAARTPSLEGSVRTGMLFHLAVARERRGEYDKAFSLIDEANAATRRLLSYDPLEHRNWCARIRHAFSRELFEHRASCGVESIVPVFVVGMPRSGTTLVEQILGGHSRIFAAGELGVIPRRVQGLNRWERRVGSGRRYPECVDDLTPEVIEGIANGILEELRELDPHATHVVDKLPHNFEHIGLIKLLFPSAKIISVRRDPRDIAISNYFTDYQAKHNGMGFAYDLTWIGQQLADHHLLMRHWHQCFPGEILEIRYEDVVDDVEGSARQMLNYLGVEWQEEVLHHSTLDRPVKTASVWQVRQPVYKTSRSRWMRYRKHLDPLIEGTNSKIEWDPIASITLPEPGLFTDGVALYRRGDLDGAELSFGKLLHHNPDHAGASFMVGLIWTRKGHLSEGLERMEAGLKQCPWNTNWRRDVVQALKLNGQHERAEALSSALHPSSAPPADVHLLAVPPASTGDRRARA